MNAKKLNVLNQMPEYPLDFLGRKLKVGDYICYPTGGTSYRMVLAKIADINDTRSDWVLKEQPYPANTYHEAGISYRWIKTKRSIGLNGIRGPNRFILSVNRIQEGAKRPKDVNNRWGVDTKRKVRIHQLHRVILVDESDVEQALRLEL
jgi:hypothetical protein